MPLRRPVLDQPLDGVDLAGFDGTFEIDANRLPGIAAGGIALVNAGRKLHLADDVAAFFGQELDDSPVAALAAGELPGLARPLDRFLGEDAMLAGDFRQLGGGGKLHIDLGLDLDHFEGLVEHAQGDRDGHGVTAAGDFLVGREHGVIDHFFVGPGVAHRGRGAHDDLFAGDGRQDGMALQHLGHVGHRAGPVQLVAGEEAGQLIGVFELGSLAGIGGPFRRDEFEHEHRPLVVNGAQRPLHGLLHTEHDAVIDGQGHADPLALPAGAVFIVFRGQVFFALRKAYRPRRQAAGASAQISARWRPRQNGSSMPPAPAGRIPTGSRRIAAAQRTHRSWKSLLPIIEWPVRESIPAHGGRDLARSYGKNCRSTLGFSLSESPMDGLKPILRLIAYRRGGIVGFSPASIGGGGNSVFFVPPEGNDRFHQSVPMILGQNPRGLIKGV